jgi:hypothetical protein
MMHHCLEEFDKGVLKSRTWHFALKKHVLRDLANYEKQVTFIYLSTTVLLLTQVNWRLPF